MIKTKSWQEIAKEISSTWSNSFTYRTERKDSDGNILETGLRPPQIGGLHSIGAHWSLSQQPATIVMPTGTGKTETMLAAQVAYNPGNILVVVPSKILRDQTAKKFNTFGLLRQLGNLSEQAQNPVIGVVTKRPTKDADLQIFEECNTVISTMSALSEKPTSHLIGKIAAMIDTLIVDEAHHVGAIGWTAFREEFSKKQVLQFTATPFRRDGKLVDGVPIYEYPLRQAQLDQYFKKISFEPIYEIDPAVGDLMIAEAAIKKLKADMADGFDHIMMARCDNITRAEGILEIYKRLAPELNPVIIHSDSDDANVNLESIKSRKSKIVVCVNMLGEGFDLPQLKIAAVHDTHKSLAVLLQFTGRFTRSTGLNIGDATVIANIADQNVSSALERLYSEDADWNEVLSELSSAAAKAHSELVNFLNDSKRLDEEDDNEKIEISHHLLRPTLNTLIFEASNFQPKNFHRGLPNELKVHSVWLHEESKTLYFVTKLQIPIKWTRSSALHDSVWDLFVLHYDESRGLIFLSTTDKTSTYEKLVEAVGGGKIVSGDNIFRVLGRINRLMFQNVGVKKHGRRNLRYAMYTGADVTNALSLSEKAGSVKANLSGTGWEDGAPITIGCSYKGRVWSREPATIPDLVKWCELVGDKIQDGTIDTKNIIDNVLIPEEVSSLPDLQILGIDWPLEIIRQSEERVIINDGAEELPISMFDIKVINTDVKTCKIEFTLITQEDEIWGTYSLKIGGDEGFIVERLSNEIITIKIGRLEKTVEEYFSNYPPLIRFIDLSELDGNLLIKPQNPQELILPKESFEIWDWTGVDIKKESILKAGVERKDSIQWKVAQEYVNENFDVVFDDDSAGEAADLICLKEEEDAIRLVLIHCKFSGSADAGERIKDIVEVCSQAIRCAKWKWKFKDLCHHLLGREKRTAGKRTTRFLKGAGADLNRFVKLSRFKQILPEIIIVQPGLSQSSCTPEQSMVMAAAHSYLKETIGVDLSVICSA